LAANRETTKENWKRWICAFPPNKSLLLSQNFLVFTCSSYTSTGGPCKEQLAIEEERISEKYAQEEAEAQGSLSKNAVVNSFGDCSKWIATATFPARLFLTRQQRI